MPMATRASGAISDGAVVPPPVPRSRCRCCLHGAPTTTTWRLFSALLDAGADREDGVAPPGCKRDRSQLECDVRGAGQPDLKVVRVGGQRQIVGGRRGTRGS